MTERVEDRVATALTNWAGNHSFAAARLHQPSSLDEVRSIVSSAPKIHALGSRHSFSDVGDAAELISLDQMEMTIAIDRDRRTVTVNPAMRYGELARALEANGLALHNMASLPHITVGGAVMTATHGSGDLIGNLATAVSALELVTSDGDLLRVSRRDADFAGIVVSLGALGVVTSLTLDVEPSYFMRQELFLHLPWETLFNQFDEVMASANSVSVFTTYGEDVGQVWRKTRIDPDNIPPLQEHWLGAVAATETLHPAPGISAENCTEQLGVVGSWADRLCHFRIDSVPASGNELQAEYMVSRRHGLAALRAIHALGDLIRPHLMTSEIRSVAADDLWLSSAYGTDTLCLHYSFKSDLDAVNRLLPVIEEALAPFEPRPHWGKLFVATARDLDPRYERLPDFRLLAERLDPRGAFRSAFLDRCLFG